ncbi:hypothetical protein PO909_014446 [Leuciscus waleckii]
MYLLVLLVKCSHATDAARLKFVQKFAVDVTLDPKTVNPRLILSDDGKQVSRGDVQQDIPENPKRFDAICVLAKQGFSSERFYYEVQVKGKTQWDLGVARESINRKGKIRLRPEDGVWTVVLRTENQYFAGERSPVCLSLRVKPEKVGVFVDYEEGLVSFYDVESRSHIYSFTGQTFTDKLYPYFSPCDNDEVMASSADHRTHNTVPIEEESQEKKACLVDDALAEVMVATTAGGRVLKPTSSRSGATRGASKDRDEGAIGCPVPEKAGPSSEELAREVLSQGVLVLGTRSGCANTGQPK